MCDWWSFGILLYELLYGKTPFFNLDKDRMYDLIKSGSICFPKYLEIKGEEKPRNYNIDEEYLNLEKSESPIGEWVKDKEYENFFNGFNEENDDMNDIPEEDNNDKDEDD